MADQLGLDVTEIKPVGLASSAGSTPLRLRVQGGPEQFVFAKLYTKAHVRADRWYKLGRSVLYGSLEDESPFKTVRRLAEYEDYALYLVRGAGVRTARPYGLVEITRGREYLLVTEFFKDAVEISQAQVDDAVIDQGLAMIRKLWRTILYGSLEDEHPFQSVRRLVEYEDYALRLLQDIGVRTARPYGIVEIDRKSVV